MTYFNLNILKYLLKNKNLDKNFQKLYQGLIQF